jgi:hypothetical protein
MRCINRNHPAVMWDWIAGLGDKWDITGFINFKKITL